MWNNYVGLSYKDNGRTREGLDCWGLVRLVYEEQYNILLPNLSEEYVLDDKERIQDLVSQYQEGWQKTEQPDVGNIVLFNILGSATHVGVYVGEKKFLHIRRGADSVVESLENPKWKNRVEGFYSYDLQRAQLVGSPHPLKTKTLSLYIQPGKTVGEVIPLIEDSNLTKSIIESNLVVLFNGKLLPKAEWNHTQIGLNDLVQYRIVPKDENFVRTALFIALVFVAPQVGLAAAGSVAGATVTAATLASAGATAIAAYAAATAATILIGSSLINAIAPVVGPTQPKDPGQAEQLILFNGSSNGENKWGSIPIVLGKIRYNGILASKPYITYDRYTVTETPIYGTTYDPEGNPIQEITGYIVDTRTTSYLHGALAWGLGPVSIRNVKIGNAPATVHPDAQILDVEFNSDPSNPIWYDQEQAAKTYFYTPGREYVYQGSELQGDFNYVHPPVTDYLPESYPIGDWIEVAMSGIATNYILNFSFPQGLRAIDKSSGGSSTAAVWVRIEWKEATSSTWNTQLSIYKRNSFFPTWNSRNPLTNCFVATDKNGFVTSLRVRLPDGYIPTAPIIFRVARVYSGTITPENFGLQILSSIVLLDITGINYDIGSIINHPPGAKVGYSVFKIPANKDFSGGLGAINAEVTSLAPHLGYQPTNNPAELFRMVLQHPANPRPVSLTEIDISKINYWSQYCNSRGFTYNSVHLNKKSILDILREIAAAGRASPAIVDGKWTVNIDEPKTTIVQHFSTHNSWGFEATRVIPKIPDGLRCIFKDETKDYNDTEIIVFKDSSTNETNSSLYETIDLPGITKGNLVYDHLKWHFAQIKLRREIYTLNTDLEYLVCNRGDRVKVTHDVPQWGLGSGRVKSYSNGQMIVFNEYLPYSSQNNYSLRIRLENGDSATAEVRHTFGLEFLNSIPEGGTSDNSVAKLTCSTGIQVPVLTGDFINITITTPGYTQFGGMSVEVLDVEHIFINNNFIKSIISYSRPFIQYLNNTPISGTLNLIPGNYDRLSVTNLSNNFNLVKQDNLFLYGLLNQESQDLIVLSVEASTNKTAKLMLVDYGVTDTYNIFQDYLNLTSTTVFETQITTTPFYRRSIFSADNYKIKLSDDTVLISAFGNAQAPTSLNTSRTIALNTWKNDNQVSAGLLSPKVYDLVYSLDQSSIVTTKSITGFFNLSITLSNLTVDSPYENWTSSDKSMLVPVYVGQKLENNGFYSLAVEYLEVRKIYVGASAVNYSININASNFIDYFEYLQNSTIPKSWTSVVLIGTTNLPSPVWQYYSEITGTWSSIPSSYVSGNQVTIPYTFLNLSDRDLTVRFVSFSTASGETVGVRKIIKRFKNTALVPNILSVVSDERVLERISNTYRPGIKLNVLTSDNLLPDGVFGIEVEHTPYVVVGNTQNITTENNVFRTVKQFENTYSTSIILRDVEEGATYYYRSRYISRDGLVGTWSQWATHTVVGKSNPPETVSGFAYTVFPTTGKVVLNWNSNPEIDVQGYEIRTSNSGWGTSTGYIFKGSTTSFEPELLNSTTYWIKAFDACNPPKYSVLGASLFVPVGIPNPVTGVVVTTPVTTNESSTTIKVSWNVPVTATFGIEKYKLTWTDDTSNPFYVTVTEVNLEPIWFTNSTVGNTNTRTLSIQSVDLRGQLSTAVTQEITVQRPNQVPSISISEVQTELGLVNITVTWSGDGVRETFPIAGYEIRTTDANWGDGAPLYKALSTSTNFALVDINSTSTWYIRAFDTIGLYSNSSQQVTYTHTRPGTPVAPTIRRDGVYLYIKPGADVLDSKFARYAIKMKKGLLTDTDDFWTSENVLATTVGPEVAIDLRSFPTPRLSTTGITYRIAMRIIDIAGSSSTSSRLSSYTIKTIKC